MDNKLIVTGAPHVKSANTTQKIMLYVILALMPSLVAANIVFGFRSTVVVGVAVAACVAFEYLFKVITKQKQSISDLSAVVTGILFAYNLPVSAPIWLVILGSFIAIVVAKQLFGGLGKNFANPALVARLVLFVSFAAAMTHWPAPYYYKEVDMITTATPLLLLTKDPASLPSLMDMFLGVRGGCLGETSVLALLIGGAFLLWKKVISPIIPVTYIATVAVLLWIAGANVPYHVMGGGLFLGAIFMATDYVTTPSTKKGMFIFGLGCGILTVVIRLFGSYVEGVSFSIVLMNLLTPLIDQYTGTKPLGGGK